MKLVIWLFCVFEVAFGSVVFPPKYRAMQTSERRLLDVRLKVNGQEKKVLHSEVLSVSIDDVVELIDARLDGGGSAGALNMVGYRNPEGHAADQGLRIPMRSLESMWRYDEPKDSYMILVSTGDQIHGYAYLRLHKDTVFSVMYKLNGEDRVVRPGEEITLKSSDEIQIIGVSSLQGDRDLDVELGSKEKSVEGDAYHQDMIISRKNYGVLAKIGLKIKN